MTQQNSYIMVFTSRIKMADAVSLCVREIGGGWVTLEGIRCVTTYTGAMKIPEQFNGKKVIII